MNAVFAVIPAYEPDETFVQVVNQARAAGFTVIVVDDGSSNGSAVRKGIRAADFYENIFLEVKRHATVLSYLDNRGKGYALKAAFRYIRDNFHIKYTVVVIDADGQHRIEDAVRIAHASMAHPNALILGSRRQGESSPLRSRFGNAVTRGVFRMATGVKIYDTQTGLRAFSNELMEHMLAVEGSRYEYEMNVLLDFAHRRIPVREISIETIYLDGNSSSHFNAIVDSIRIYRDIFRFGCSGFASFLVDYGLFGLFVWILGASAHGTLLANIAARIISASFNYHLNRNYVFSNSGNLEETEPETAFLKKVRRRRFDKHSALQYAALASIILAVNSAILYVLIKLIGINALIAKVVTECLLFFVSYTIQKRFIFRESKDSFVSEKQDKEHLAA